LQLDLYSGERPDAGLREIPSMILLAPASLSATSNQLEIQWQIARNGEASLSMSGENG
jgi:hypothetical protein